MRNIYQIGLPILFAATFAAAGCNNTTVTSNGNAQSSTASANVSNANSANNSSANVNSGQTAPSVLIDAREPETYQATVGLRLETIGEKQANLPTITANVARSGVNQRMEFNLPNGEKLIYLDANGKHLLVSPNRKQYAELNQESLGFEVRNLMTPAQMVKQLQNVKGVERVGEEQFNGRTVVKYRLAAVTNTQTQAGQVNTESYFLIDKDTGLPLRTEAVSQSQGGQVQGLQGLHLITEMSNIQTTVSPELFAEPTDFKKVAPEEVRAQVEGLMKIAGALIGNAVNTSAQPANNSGAGGGASASPSPSTTP